MGPDIFRIIIMTIFTYFITLFLSRLLGRKLISQMTFFDFVIGIMLGTAAVNASSIQDKMTLSGYTILFVVALLTIIVDFTHLKNILIRKVLESEPVILIEKGKINDTNMKKIRISLEELLMLLREKSIFNLEDVENAIFEPDGKLSVQRKSEKLPLTPSDINLSTPYRGLSRDVVIDGKILDHNLNYINLDELWLKNQLLSYGIQDIKDVFYAGLDTSGNLYVSKKITKNEEPGQHGIE